MEKKNEIIKDYGNLKKNDLIPVWSKRTLSIFVTFIYTGIQFKIRSLCMHFFAVISDPKMFSSWILIKLNILLLTNDLMVGMHINKLSSLQSMLFYLFLLKPVLLLYYIPVLLAFWYEKLIHVQHIFCSFIFYH